MKPSYQPQPAPPAQVTPGVATGPNGRPPGDSPKPYRSPLGAVPLPQAGEITTQRPPAVAPPAPVAYSFKVASPVYPEIAVGRPTFNPITGEWILPR